MPGSCSAFGSLGSGGGWAGAGAEVVDAGGAPASAMACSTASLTPLCFSLMSVSGAVSNLHGEDLILATTNASGSVACIILIMSSFVRGATFEVCAQAGSSAATVRTRSKDMAKKAEGPRPETLSLHLGTSVLWPWGRFDPRTIPHVLRVVKPTFTLELESYILSPLCG